MVQSAVERFQKEIGEKSWDTLYKRLKKVNRDIASRGIQCYDGRMDLITGYSYGEFYDWDLYFENIYMSYYGIHEYCRNNVEAFLDQQLACGFVSRTIIQPRMQQHFKPFLAQIALLGAKQSGNFQWLRGKYYDRLKKYIDYWFWYCDLDKNGLCIWDSADHSGMDNQNRRAGAMYEKVVEGVDLNCYLYRELLALAEIAEKLGESKEKEQFLAHADTLAGLINRLCWDEEDGFYYDRHERRGELIKVKTVCGFLPLWAGIAPKERAERLVKEHLLNPDEFWLTYPVATWSKSEPDYYQQRKGGECNWMGTTWIPTNYMVFHGLLDYGYFEIGKQLAYKTFELVLSETETREYYNGETGCGQGLNPFWGWSTLGYYMPLEFEARYNPMDIDAKEILPLGEWMNIHF